LVLGATLLVATSQISFRLFPAIALVFPAAALAAQTATLGWPEVIDDLTKERGQAETCVGLIKSSADEAAIAGAKVTYGTARDMDGVIAGLTTALVEGGKPESLPTVRASPPRHSLS
jgi:hypothetical protein